MKKYLNYLFVFFIVMFITYQCNASTNTFVRTNEDLKVPKDIIVDENNYDSIMSTPSVSASEKVYDYADLLTDEQEKNIYNNIMEFNRKSKYDIVILTTKELNGKNVSAYTYNFYDYNDFSDGLIFTIYVGGEKPSIFVGNSAPDGSELFTIYDNNIINSTLKYLYTNSISKGNYNEACLNFVKIINGFYEKKYSNSYNIDDDGNVVHTIPLLEIIIFSIAFTFIIVLIIVKKFSMKKNKIDRFVNKINNDSLKIISDYDNLVSKQ